MRGRRDNFRPKLPQLSLLFGAGIAFDAAANTGSLVASTGATWNIAWTGASRALTIDVHIFSVPGTTVTAMTYGGAACTLIGVKSTVSGAGRVEMWRITAADSGAPAAGTNTISVTLSAAVTWAGTAVSYTGVHQTSPTEGFNSAQATNGAGAADATVTITPIANSTMIHAAVSVDDDAITALQTIRNNVSATGVASGADEDTGPITPAAATAVGFTDIAGLKTWAVAGYALRPLAASSGSTTYAAAYLDQSSLSVSANAGTKAFASVG